MNLFSIALFSPPSWAGIGAPLANHLWQSTVFAGAVWLLTLLLRKNHAQSRCALWFVASAKFLIPFSLLVGLGSHLGWSRTAAVTQPQLFIAMEAIGQPFEPTILAPIPSPAAPGDFAIVARLLPASLLLVWFAGCVFVLFVWYLRWRRLTAARRAAPPSKSGLELELLRRIERTAGFSQQIDLVLSKSALEPGILGVFRPALVLPVGISEKLTDAQLESVISHELCHVRRRDNLAAGFHMLVEALFWFHPLVWWMGARLVEERERACDEEVLRLGADPHVYAEGILKVCKFYLEFPLSCAAGVTGSNLKKRIEAIMTNRIAPKLELGKKLLLSALGVTALLGPIAFGLLHAPQSRAQAQAQNASPEALAFESVSIKPNTTGEPMAGFVVKGLLGQAIMFRRNKFMATNFTLRGLISVAYEVQESQIAGGPDWLGSEKFDVNATIGGSLMDELSKLSKEEDGIERRRMLQALLADRFKLVLHRETRPAGGYALVIAKNGPKLQQATPGDTYPNGLKGPQGRPNGPGIWQEPCKYVGQGVPIAALVRVLSQTLNRVVVDKTNLQGNYDFTLDCHTAFMERGESIFTVLPEQLGLELNEQTLPVETLVIDHAEQIAGDESSQTQPQVQSVAESHAQNVPAIVPGFEVASVQLSRRANEGTTVRSVPGKLTLANWTTSSLIGYAYNTSHILGGPAWMGSERYVVDAKVDDSLAYESGKLIGFNSEGRFPPGLRHRQLMKMLQSLLADRFKLRLSHETRQVPAYALAIAEGGLKLHESRPGDTYSNGILGSNGVPVGPNRGAGENGHLTAQALPMSTLAEVLTQQLGRPVLDRTRLTSDYDFTLDWTPNENRAAATGQQDSILTAIQQQLGLKLEPLELPTEFFVVDHVEKPTQD